MIKAVLFDLDDLMVNSEPLHVKASAVVFEPYGVDLNTLPFEVVSSFFGIRVIEILGIIADHYGLNHVDIKSLMKKREEIFLKLVRDELEMMPGLPDIVALVKKLGLRRALASSGTRVYIETVIEKFGLNEFFETYVSGDMVEHGKPAPDVFLEAARRLGVRPEECVVLEDAFKGVSAAKSAGMYCIGVDNQLSPYKQDLRAADHIVKRLDEIDENLLTCF